jgi:hypothetical protein
MAFIIHRKARRKNQGCPATTYVAASRGVARRHLGVRVSGLSRVDQVTVAGSPTTGSLLQEAVGFQGHVSGALDGPFVVSYEDYSAHGLDDGVVGISINRSETKVDRRSSVASSVCV